jgi:GSH-dependent disulfide-bond oxidoreductase
MINGLPGDCVCRPCLRKAAGAHPDSQARPGTTTRAGETGATLFVYREPPQSAAARQETVIIMIDFYALTSPNVQKIFIMLEECGLPYNVKPVDVWAGEQFTPEFAKINPLQKVPAIIDSDGPDGKPYTVIESGAILIYLAEKTGRFIPHEPVARYDTLQWLIVQVANVGPMSGQHVHFSKFAGAGNDYSARRYRTQVLKLFDLYEQRLGAHPFVAGREYTIADIAAWPWLRNFELLAVDPASYPTVKKWADKIAARDAVKQALAKVATLKSVRDKASDDQKDRFFARGNYARA